MLWSLVTVMLLSVVPDNAPGHIGLSMMVNIRPPDELRPAGEAQKANRAMVMFYWNSVEGDSVRRESYNFNRYDDIMNNLPSEVSVLGVLGWGTPKWASRARWIYDTLMEHFHCHCAETLRNPYVDSCLYYQNIYTNTIKDRYYPPRPDSTIINDSAVSYMDLWLRYVDTIVKRYSDRVKYYEIWYEMYPNPPKYNPWKEDFIKTMRDTGWFFNSFYIPTAKVIYNACYDCKLVLPPEAGGNTLYDSYASFIDSTIAAGVYHYHNDQKGRFYKYYDLMFSYFSAHPEIHFLYCADSVRRPGECQWVDKPLFEYADIHLYPYRYAPYYVDSSGVLLDVLSNTLNIKKEDHVDYDTVTNYTIKGAIDLVDSLAGVHGVNGRINGYFLT